MLATMMVEKFSSWNRCCVEHNGGREAGHIWWHINRKDIHALDFHSNGQIPPDDQYALLFILSGGTHSPKALSEPLPQASTPRDAGGASLLSGRHPRLQCDWISSGTAPEREARTNGVYPSSSTPSMIDHVIPHRAPTVIYVGTTRRQRMRCLSGLAWPPLL